MATRTEQPNLTPAQWRVLEAMGEGAVFMEICPPGGLPRAYIVISEKEQWTISESAFTDLFCFRTIEMEMGSLQPRSRVYELTPAGREALERRKEEVKNGKQN